jgi:hypothetical protein
MNRIGQTGGVAIKAQASKTKTGSAAKFPLLDLDLFAFPLRVLFAP